MAFDHLWALALLALLPVLWLARQEPPRTRVVVAGRFLWAARTRRDSTLGTKTARHDLVWIQAALLGALIVSLAGPRLATAPDTVALVLDTSMSMGARDQNGTRLDTARRRALATLTATGATTTVRVWSAGGTPTLVGTANSAARLESVLATVSPTSGWGDLAGAIARAEQDAPRPRRIYVVSDGQPLRAPNLEWLAVGSAADNLAVTSLVAARDADGRARWMLEVHNFGGSTVRAAVALTVGSQAPTRRTVEVPAGRASQVAGTASDVPPGAVVTARLEAADALPADDVRYAVVTSAAQTRVATDGRSPFLEAALAALPRVVRVASRDEPHDVLVCVDCGRASEDDTSSLLTLGTPSTEPAVPVAVTRVEHPIVSGVTLDGLHVVRARPAATTAGTIVVARAGDRPVILASDDERRRVVELRFDSADDGVGLDPSFPLLVANIVDWLADAHLAPAAVRAGDPFTWRTGLLPPATRAVATDPAGRVLTVTAQGGLVVVADTAAAGIYGVDVGGSRVTFAVNPAAADESDLSSPPAPVTTPGPQAVADSPTTSASMDLSPVLLTLGLVLTLIETWARIAVARRVGRTMPWPRVATRAAAAVLLVAAIAGLRLWTGAAPVAVSFAIDRSESTSASWRSWLDMAKDLAGTLGTTDLVGLTVFGDAAVVERRVQEGRLPAGTLESAVERAGTNIERALQAARASLPPDGNRRILLFSDGRQTSGDAVREAVQAAADGVRIDVVPPTGDSVPAGRAARMMAPSTVRQNEPFDLEVLVEGRAGVEGTLRLFGGGTPRERRVTVPQHGSLTATFADRAGTPGLRTYRAVFTPDSPDFAFAAGDDEAQVGTVVSVVGPPRALYAGRHREAVAPALAEAGFLVEAVEAAAIPIGPALTAFDAVVLDGVDPAALGQDQRTALVQHVDLGGGLLVLGTEGSLPAGSSGDASFDEMLPVDPRPRGGARGAGLALVVAFDKSGSMEERVAGTPKIEFAREAVRNLVAALPPGDAVGVIAFNGAPVPVAALETSRDVGRLDAALRAVRPEGPTAIGPALERAREWLTAPAASAFDKKHVLLISDGQTSAEDLARARLILEERRFVLSVVAVGAGSDRDALNALALESGGRAYFSDDVRDLPGTVAREATRVAGGRTVVAAFQARLGNHPLARGVAGAPRLGGYVVTAARPGAEVVLRSHLDDPVLAVGRSGLGRVAVYTADLHSRWSDGLRRWPEFNAFFARTVRWVSRTTSHPLLHASMRGTPSGFQIDVEAGDGGGLVGTPLEIRGLLRAPSGAESELTFTALEPGRYEARSPIGPTGAYVASVTAASADGSIQGSLVRGVYYSAPQELEHSEPDLSLLARVAAQTGGRVFSPDRPALEGRRAGYREGRSWFTAIALLLLFAAFALTGLARVAADLLRRWDRRPLEQTA